MAESIMLLMAERKQYGVRFIHVTRLLKTKQFFPLPLKSDLLFIQSWALHLHHGCEDLLYFVFLT